MMSLQYLENCHNIFDYAERLDQTVVTFKIYV